MMPQKVQIGLMFLDNIFMEFRIKSPSYRVLVSSPGGSL